MEGRLSSHAFEQEGMEVSFPKENPTIGGFPTHEEEVEGNSVGISRYYLVPHVV